jgi:hypothetical protein
MEERHRTFIAQPPRTLEILGLKILHKIHYKAWKFYRVRNSITSYTLDSSGRTLLVCIHVAENEVRNSTCLDKISNIQLFT